MSIFHQRIALLTLVAVACACGPILADDGPPALRVVLIPERNAYEQRSQFSHITNFLSEKLGQNVYLEVMPDYEAAMASLASGQADIGFLGGLSYLEARDRGNVVALVRPIWTSGEATCRAYVVARRDSGIADVASMRGKKLILGSRHSFSAWLFPLYYLANSGVGRVDGYFSSVSFDNAQDTILWSVFMRENDVGAVKSCIFDRMTVESPAIRQEVAIVARSSPVPANCLAVRASMPQEMQDRLQFLLTSMDKVDDGKEALARFGALRFVRTTEGDFTLLASIIREYGNRNRHQQSADGEWGE
ncbi:MAG: phosphate/phosphite/phosphonate ABC transporter substrate-binding protein [Thermodesulfobacteriota bacterium]